MVTSDPHILLMNAIVFLNDINYTVKIKDLAESTTVNVKQEALLGKKTNLIKQIELENLISILKFSAYMIYCWTFQSHLKST